MSVYDNIIRDVQSGQPLTLQRYGYGLPNTVTLSGVRLWIKNKITDVDGNALFSSLIGPNPQPQGQITSQVVATGEIVFYFFIPPTSAVAVVTVGSGNAAITYSGVAAGYQYGQVTIVYSVAGPSLPLTVAVSGTAQVSGVGIVGTVVTVGVATDGSSNPTSTAAQIIAAVNANASASQLVVAALAVGSDGTGVVASQSAVPLTGGQTGTVDFMPSNQYPYQMTLLLSDGTQSIFESGNFSTRGSTDVTAITTLISGARAAESGSARSDNILNNYVDANIELFRRLKCWDLSGRRAGNDSSLIVFPFRHWNPTFPPEVYDDQNNSIPYGNVSVDFDAGTVRVAGETGNETYYVTFRFDYFGPLVLNAFLNMTLQELNVAGAQQRYLTSYATVDATPLAWDAPLALGVLVKCYRRLALDSGLWGLGHNIWVDGSAGPTVANEIANAYDATLTELKQSLKWGRFVSIPTGAYWATVNSGFGFFGGYANRFGGFMGAGQGGFDGFSVP